MKKLNTHSRITKSEAVAFRRRWEIVNAFEKKELRALTVDKKLEQLTMLIASAKEFDWTNAPEAEANEVRDRWNKLRKAYHA